MAVKTGSNTQLQSVWCNGLPFLHHTIQSFPSAGTEQHKTHEPATFEAIISQEEQRRVELANKDKTIQALKHELNALKSELKTQKDEHNTMNTEHIAPLQNR
eukprot:330672_1